MQIRVHKLNGWLQRGHIGSQITRGTQAIFGRRLFAVACAIAIWLYDRAIALFVVPATQPILRYVDTSRIGGGNLLVTIYFMHTCTTWPLVAIKHNVLITAPPSVTNYYVKTANIDINQQYYPRFMFRVTPLFRFAHRLRLCLGVPLS